MNLWTSLKFQHSRPHRSHGSSAGGLILDQVRRPRPLQHGGRWRLGQKVCGLMLVSAKH